MAVWSRSPQRAARSRTSRSDCAASAVSASRLTDRRRQRGPSAGAAAHAAPVKQDPCYSIGASELFNRQLLGKNCDETKMRCGFPRLSYISIFVLSAVLWPAGYFIYCKYPSSKYRREYIFPLCEACLHIVKRKAGLSPSSRPHTGQSWTRARSPPRAVCRARAVCLCQRPLPPIDRLWADSCERFSVYRWWPVAGTGLPEVAAHDGCDATDTPRCC